MTISPRPLFSLAGLASLMALFVTPAYADQLVYVPLKTPCRLLDTRTSTGGSGPLTAADGAHLISTLDSDIPSQNGNPAGCGIPNGTAAVSINMNLLNATGSGDIATWSSDAGSTAPNIGTAVYNPTVARPAAGQVQYNTGYTTVPIGDSSKPAPGMFYLQVANGQVDMTINVVGYWLAISLNETRKRGGVVALGVDTTASGFRSTAMGYGTIAHGDDSTAMGFRTTADGEQSTAMGSNVGSGGHAGSFIYGDAVSRPQVVNTADNQFVVAATGGVYFFSSCATACTAGVGLAPGSGSWFSLSDRNAKTAVRPMDGREVLKKVAALPLNTWQYKTQDAKYRHMGPMAQDFYAAFQLGESDKSIDTVDAEGVALAAIQGLSEELTEKNRQIIALKDEASSVHSEMASIAKSKDAEIAELHAELSAQKAEVQTQKTRIAALESLAGDVANLKVRLSALRPPQAAPVTIALKQP